MSSVSPAVTWHVRWPCAIGTLVRDAGIGTLVNIYGKESDVLQVRFLYISFPCPGQTLKNIFLRYWHVRCLRVKNM